MTFANNKKRFVTVLFSLIFLLLSTALYANAADYTFLEPLPGLEEAESQEGLFTKYASNIFILSLGIAAVLAVFMIVVGGVQYAATSINPSAKEAAKKRIWGAISGLLIILGAYLILYTINPDLVNLNLNIPCVIEAAPGEPPTC